MKTRMMAICAAVICLVSCGKAEKETDNGKETLQWRGVMIDASRHFWPMEVLERQVDLMGQYGLNVLHLHLTDAAGWRMEIKKYPRLTEVGAWRTHQTWKDCWAARPKGGKEAKGVEWFAPAYADSINGYGGYYTQDELRQLVRYAAQRGVTIVPEIEFPAHSEEAVAAYPWLGYNHAEMDMEKDSTFLFMADVLAEVADVFPGPYIHVGGDEAETQKGKQPAAMRRIQTIVEGLGRRMIVWDEGLTDEPADSGQIIMVWRNIDTATKAIRLGHEVILCPGGWCYLDSYQDRPATEPEAMGGYRPLSHVYTLPLDSALQAEKESTGKLLGVQACLFTEYVPTPAVLENQLWPRALAMAEIGMGRKRSYEDFRLWAMEVTDSMRREGIQAFDLRHEYGQRHEAETPVAHLAREAKVAYDTPYSSYYPAGGDSALTDGVRGTWNNNDGRWQGFSHDMGTTVMLDGPREVAAVEMTFMQMIGPDIFLPATVEVTLLNGTEPAEPIAQCTLAVPDSLTDTPIVYHPYKAVFAPACKATGIHVAAHRPARGGWLFLDEVVVR